MFLWVCIWVLFFLLMFPCRNHLQDRWPIKLLRLSLTNTCLRQLGIKEEFSSFNALKEKQAPDPNMFYFPLSPSSQLPGKFNCLVVAICRDSEEGLGGEVAARAFGDSKGSFGVKDCSGWLG